METSASRCSAAARACLSSAWKTRKVSQRLLPSPAEQGLDQGVSLMWKGKLNFDRFRNEIFICDLRVCLFIAL